MQLTLDLHVLCSSTITYPGNWFKICAYCLNVYATLQFHAIGADVALVLASGQPSSQETYSTVLIARRE